MCLLFKFRQAIPEIFQFLYLTKLGLFGIRSGDYIGAFEHWNGTKKHLFSCFITKSQWIN